MLKKEIINKYYEQYLSEVFETDTDLEEKVYFNINNLPPNKTTLFLKNGKKVTYDLILDFQDGYAAVKNRDDWNFIDEDGNLISEKWFDDAYSFNEGYAPVIIDNGYNFINTRGEFLLKNNLNCSVLIGQEGFYNGIAIIGNKDENNCYYKQYIDLQGIPLFDKKFTIAQPFIGNYAIATEAEKIYLLSRNGIIKELPNNNIKHYIQLEEKVLKATEKNLKSFLTDLEGNKIGNITFDYCFQSKEGLYRIKNNDKYNFIDKNGQLISENWYDQATDFKNGYAAVKLDDKYNFIDKNGTLLLEEWVLYANPFSDEIAIINTSNGYTLLSENGQISNENYDYIYNFQNGYSIVLKDNKKNLINKEGKIISNLWFDECYQFYNGYALVKKDGKYNYIDQNGELKLNDWYEYGLNFQYGVGIMYADEKIYIFDNDLEEINVLNQPLDFKKSMSIHRSVSIKPIELIESKKNWIRYTYFKEDKRIRLDYKPLYEYDDLIICKNEENNNIYTYNKINKQYTLLCKNNELFLGTNYIKIKDRTYYISNTDLIDITKFNFKYTIKPKDGVTRILTLSEFSEICEQTKYKEAIDAEINNIKENELKIKAEKLQKKLEQKKYEEEKRKQNKINKVNNALKQVSLILENVGRDAYILEQEGQNHISKKMIVPEELLFIKVDDHKEFNSMFLDNKILRFVDFSSISFENVKVSGLDLSYTNANIDPQEVYNKDMSNGVYRGLNFNLKSFADVNIENSDFTNAIVDFAFYESTLKK